MRVTKDKLEQLKNNYYYRFRANKDIVCSAYIILYTREAQKLTEMKLFN